MFKKIIKIFFNLIFPVNCFSCGREGLYLCKKCFSELKFYEEGDKKLKLFRANLKNIFIAGDYNNKLLSQLIIAFKYQNIKSLSLPLARFLIFFWDGVLKNFDLAKNNIFSGEQFLVTFIPLSKRRKRQRGFNQSEEIAKIFCDEFSYNLENILSRKSKKKNQAKLSAKKREFNVRNVFYFKSKIDIKDKTIILIDDVITTGATLNEAARVLLLAGAKEVYALVLARA